MSIIILTPPPPPEEKSQPFRAGFDTIYDKARAIIAEAEASGTLIEFQTQPNNEEPQT